MDRSGKYILASIREVRSYSEALNLAACEKIYLRCGDWSLWKSPFASISRISSALPTESVLDLFIMQRGTHAMHQASAVNAYISRRMCTWQTRDIVQFARILFARSRCSGASFLILFTFFPDTRRQENILRNITRARVIGAVWSARHANATRSSYVTAGFQKCRSGMLGMRHLDMEEL